MNFELTDAQKTPRNEVRGYAQTTIKPAAIELDRDEKHPSAILADLANRGYAGITLPEKFGGKGEGLIELSLLIEELSAVLRIQLWSIADWLFKDTTRSSHI